VEFLEINTKYGKDVTTIDSSIRRRYLAMLALSYKNQQDVNRGCWK
jgi:hypothetical protein